MAIPAFLGNGVLLGYGASSGGSFTSFAEIRDFTPPKLEVADVKNTNHDTAGVTHSYQPGWIEPGSLELKLVYAGAQHNTLTGFLRTIQWYKITYPNGGTEIFQGYIKAIGRTCPIEDIMETEVTIKLMTKPIAVAGS